MKLRSAQIGSPTWAELNEKLVDYLKEVTTTDYGKPVMVAVQPITTALLPTYQLTVSDVPKGEAK